MPKSTLSLIATLAFCLFSAFAIARAQDAVPHRLQFQIPPTSVQRPMSAEAVRRAVTGTATPSGASGTSLLPVFNYEVASSRGGNVYDGDDRRCASRYSRLRGPRECQSPVDPCYPAVPHAGCLIRP
jgi:hypothetical protein